MGSSYLIRLLRDRLSQEQRDLLDHLYGDESRADYDRLLERIVAKAARLEQEAERNRERVRARYRDLIDQPEGRRRTLLLNSPPALLLALTRDLMAQSFAARWDEPQRSLDLARLAVTCSEIAGNAGRLSSHLRADLKAEALAYLGNALRINSDLAGAESAFEEALELLDRGTGDRLLRADLFSFLASHRFGQGRARSAGQLLDREIKLRRLLGDREREGFALIDRGIVACWSEPLRAATDYLYEGVALVRDPVRNLLALHALAERLARDGRGLQALKVVWRAQSLSALAEVSGHATRLRWIEGVTYRALGQLEVALSTLLEVRGTLLSENRTFKAALLSLDLSAVYAAQGKTEDIKKLAREAHTVFRTEGLAERALAAFLVFHKAAMAEKLTEELAVRVADFLVRYQHNRQLRFEETPPT